MAARWSSNGARTRRRWRPRGCGRWRTRVLRRPPCSAPAGRAAGAGVRAPDRRPGPNWAAPWRGCTAHTARPRSGGTGTTRPVGSTSATTGVTTGRPSSSSGGSWRTWTIRRCRRRWPIGCGGACAGPLPELLPGAPAGLAHPRRPVVRQRHRRPLGGRPGRQLRRPGAGPGVHAVAVACRTSCSTPISGNGPYEPGYQRRRPALAAAQAAGRAAALRAGQAAEDRGRARPLRLVISLVVAVAVPRPWSALPVGAGRRPRRARMKP